jgi:predicted transcriptional regulator
MANTVILPPIRVSPTVKAKLDALARAVHRSRSATLRALILGATVDHLPRAWRAISRDGQALLAEAEGHRR